MVVEKFFDMLLLNYSRQLLDFIGLYVEHFTRKYNINNWNSIIPPSIHCISEY